MDMFTSYGRIKKPKNHRFFMILALSLTEMLTKPKYLPQGLRKGWLDVSPAGWPVHCAPATTF